MSPFATRLSEEGVLIRGRKVVGAGESRLEELRQLLASGPHPSRNVASNLADVTAQIAANRLGAARLLDLIEQRGLEVIQSYMRHVQDAAEAKTRQAIRRLPNGTRTFADHMDDGSRIQVAVTISGETAHVDFSGSAGVNPGSLNANRAIVRAAVLYSLRCLVDEEIPLNEGIWRPVTLTVPPGMLAPPADDDPARCPAVGGGNVETSQRLVDVMLGVLELAAASQGTMNNLLFGDENFGYYETICGGAGATPNCNGAHAVHTHMTNTRLTDPEVLETRYPVRLISFRIRRGSGGLGAIPGWRRSRSRNRVSVGTRCFLAVAAARRLPAVRPPRWFAGRGGKKRTGTTRWNTRTLGWTGGIARVARRSPDHRHAGRWRLRIGLKMPPKFFRRYFTSFP